MSDNEDIDDKEPNGAVDMDSHADSLRIASEKEMRHLRACLLCGLVKSIDQFETQGCDNCERFLSLKDGRERVYECTSSNFTGIIAMMSPADSWVAKWQRIGQKFVKGTYAVSVTGRLPDYVISDLKDHGIEYRSKDTSLRT